MNYSRGARYGALWLLCLMAAGCADSGDDVPPAPGADVVVSLSADPGQIVLGLKSLLTWSAAHARSCAASGAWSGARPLSGSELVTPTMTGAQAYRLDCAGDAAPGSASVTITVLPPPDPFADARAEFTRLRQLETRTSSPP